MGRKKPPRVSGVVRVDKPAGCTSHDVVQRLRRAFGQSQVGHTGTLDPAATGLMVVTLGRATRIARFIEATDKSYVGTVRLGTTTTTADAEGEVVESAEVPEFSDASILEALSRFRGTIEQTPPAFSAIKVDGERLHERARRGEVVEVPRRTVDIHDLELVDRTTTELTIRARVSKGTYIRSLAVDIGAALGLPAHLSYLRRLTVGSHRVEEAVSPDRFFEPDPPVIAPAAALGHLPVASLDHARTRDVAHGRPIRVEPTTGGNVRLLSPEGDLVAIATPHPETGRIDRYEVVLVRPEEVSGTV